MAPGTLQKSIKYSRITPTSTPRSCHIKKNPAPEAKKRYKTVQFDGTAEEVNIMTARDATIPRKKNGESQAKNPNSDKDTEVPE